MLVSFDFDSTLALPQETGAWKPNWAMLHRMMWHLARGDSVIIVTARSKQMEPYASMSGAPQVKDFVYAYQLPISEIYFTGGRLKGPSLHRLGVELHYDDKDEEIEEAEAWGIRAVQVA